MIYFDSNVLVHYFTTYEPAKHVEAKQLVEQAVVDRAFYITMLCVQETAFALAKLQQPLPEINLAVNQLLLTASVGYQRHHFQRASQLAQHLGFQNINDCLHTALAEARNCSELLTYNRKDFSRIQSYTSMKIRLL